MTGTSVARNADAIRTETAIKVARVICILGIVYVHSWTGLTLDQSKALSHGTQSVYRAVLVELLGRSSVPLLSVISGYLVVGSAMKRSYGRFVGGKARAIVAPMVAWNAIAILTIPTIGTLAGMQVPVPRDAQWFADELFALTRANDINVQMPFLRDLFLCMLAAPLLVRARGWMLGIAAALVLAWILTEWRTILFLRPPILLFFLIGIGVRRAKIGPKLAQISPLLVLPAFLLLGGVKLWTVLEGPIVLGTLPLSMAAVDLVLRFAGALAFWQAAWRLADSRFSPIFWRLEPYMFLLFCSHLVVLWLGGPLIGQFTGALGAPLYPAYLTLQPALVLVFTLFLAIILRRLPASIGDILSGGRLPRGADETRQPALAVSR
ncbi:acyltransferase family protein [Sphingomonas sanxanigenens]|uniref:Acyltransferase 3 domain-containing protein n=1 Tax=Sphingomonas sanxanigenens DSM 19645 = NX02 TaxID=1123269 RepID=W0ABX9_9SPHN|nr:acyltransferase [Sphingomonas sanxanigenens]AHE53185.1 hypothetical protein NX02_07295 [Sphingomonas sanxanigenens DSM 19645 = NX02]